MLDELRLWQQKIDDGIKVAQNFYAQNQRSIPRDIENIIFVGMGGSGIAGRILKTFIDARSNVTSMIIEGTAIPLILPRHSLVIAISYSGNTWETLNCIEKFISDNVPMIILSNGGAAKEIANKNKIPFIEVPGSKTPRSALGIFLGILLELFEKLNILKGNQILERFKEQIESYSREFEDQQFFKDFLTIASNKEFFHVFGISGDSASSAFRAQTQFNENSKVQAVFSAFPELCHNLLVGFSQVEDSASILLLYTDFVDKNIQIDLKILKEILEERGVVLYKPSILGDTWEEQLFYIILWSDYASYHLARIRGVEVAPVKIIDLLKSRQKKHHLGG